MLTPGFLSDLVGVALLLPPVRAVLRPVLLARLQAMALGAAVGPGVRRRRTVRDDVIDV
jgi:UPF0716 family protein affecting phage T7 exclusion